jgi:xylulokinase
MLFCGIDAGTTGVKAFVFDEKGNPVSSSYRVYDIQVDGDGTRRLKAKELWDKTLDAFGEAAFRALKKTGGSINCLCADSFGEAFVSLDAQGNILHDPMIFTDRWGEKEYFEAEKKVTAEEIARICGLPLSPSYSLSKILYLKEERPEVYQKINKILLIEDFISYMFSGCTAADYSTASRTMFFDVAKAEWSAGLLSRFDLDAGHFSDPVPMGTIIGKVHQHILDKTGLQGEIAVVAGGHDQPVNAIGSGLRAGYAVNSMGTSECVTPITGNILPAGFIALRGIPSEPLWEKGKFCCLAYNVSSGLLVQWFANTVVQGEENPIKYLDGHVPPQPSKIMVQPYLMGSGTPYMDSAARMAFTGIDYGSTKFDMYRAILEGLVLDQKLNFSVLAEQNVHVKHLIAVGGGSRSVPWLQIKADILEIPVSTLAVKEAGALGAAVLCAVASGVYGSVEEAAAAMSRIDKTIEPDLKHHGFYTEKFEVYKKLHDKLEAVNFKIF